MAEGPPDKVTQEALRTQAWLQRRGVLADGVRHAWAPPGVCGKQG